MAIFNVSSAAELRDALNSAAGGDEIRLASGDYGEISIRNMDFGSGITITSADASSPAEISRLSVVGSSGVSFEEMVFDYDFSLGDPYWDTPFEVRSSSGISFVNSQFLGDNAFGTGGPGDGYPTGKGLNVIDSSGVTVEGSEFSTWHRGMVFSQSQDISVIGNNVHTIRSDGMDFVEVQRVLIEDNFIHDFRAALGSEDHGDMIQFWTSGTDSPSTDIVIRGNTLDIGNGTWTQSIFMRNEEVDLGRAGEEMFYQNFLIEDNVIYNAHLHGITVGETDGLIVRNNSVIQADGDLSNPNNAGRSGGVTIPQIRLSQESKNVVIEQNAAVYIDGYQGQYDWSLQNNVLIQNTDPSAANYYSDVFTTESLEATGGARNYIVKQGSILDIQDAGAMSMQPEGGGSSSGSSTPTVGTDASTPEDTSGAPAEEEAEATEPAPVEQTPSGEGENSQDSGSRIIDDYVLDIASLTGASALGYDAEVVSTETGEVIRMDGDRDYVSLGRLAEFEAAQQISFSIDFKRAEADNSDARLVWNHMKYGLVLDGDDLVLRVTTSSSDMQSIRISGLGLNDVEQHNVKVILDAEADQVQVILDGQIVLDNGGFGLDFVGAGGNEWGWTLGTPWGSSFNGDVSSFSIESSAQFTDEGTSSGTENSETDATSEPQPSDISGPAPSEEPAPLVEPEPIVVTDPEPNQQDPVLVLDDYVLDIDTLADSRALKRGAEVVVGEDGSVIELDGENDYVQLGRLTEFEEEQQISFSVDFARGEADGSTDRVVWNHMKYGLSVQDDGLVVQVATADEGFKSFTVKDLGLNDTETHSVQILMDAEDDRLQVVLDDEVVLDETDTDLNFVGAGGNEWGWMLGTPWGRRFDGEISDFRIEADADFIMLDDAGMFV